MEGDYDVIKVCLGSISYSAEIEIEVSYIEELQLSMNIFKKFTIFSTIVPLFNTQNESDNPFEFTKQAKTLGNYPFIKAKNQDEEEVNFPWSLYVVV